MPSRDMSENKKLEDFDLAGVLSFTYVQTMFGAAEPLKQRRTAYLIFPRSNSFLVHLTRFFFYYTFLPIL